MTNPDIILKSRDYFANKGPSSQSYGFSSSHVWMWELSHKEVWTPKNQCVWDLVLEKTLERPLHCKEIKPVNSKGNQSWIFIRRTDAKAEAPILWSPMQRAEDWRLEEEGMTEDEMVVWHHWLNGHEFEQASGVGEEQRSLAFYSRWGCQESNMTEQLNNNKNNNLSHLMKLMYYIIIIR